MIIGNSILNSKSFGMFTATLFMLTLLFILFKIVSLFLLSPSLPQNLNSSELVNGSGSSRLEWPSVSPNEIFVFKFQFSTQSASCKPNCCTNDSLTIRFVIFMFVIFVIDSLINDSQGSLGKLNLDDSSCHFSNGTPVAKIPRILKRRALVLIAK